VQPMFPAFREVFGVDGCLIGVIRVEYKGLLYFKPVFEPST